MHSGGTAYVETGGKEPIEVQVFSRTTGKPLINKTSIQVRIRRHEDDFYYDWIDDTFKTSIAIGQMYETLTAVDNTLSPGLYRLDTATHVKGFDTSKVTNLLAGSNTLEITVVQTGETDAGGLPTGFELKVGNFLDTILRIVALQKENYYIDQMVYNTPGLMTSARIRLFKDKASAAAATDGGTGEGEFATYSFTAVPNVTRTHLADEVRSVRDS